MIICSDQRSGQGCGGANRDNARFCVYCGLPLRYGLLLHNPGAEVGAYRTVRVLGHGMFGAVYEADAIQRVGERVALKATIDPSSIGSFRAEFAALSQLQHPGLPRYHELFEANGNAYLVMELIPGQSLDDLLASWPNGIGEREALHYALQLCAVLGYLHGQRPALVHRDIKPANIRLTPEGMIKLVDFGLLKQDTQRTRMSIRGVGTPAYAPIEQYGGAGMTDPRSDIYSLGATLYHLLTGREPPPATERVAALIDPLRAPHRVKPSISRRTSEVVSRALALGQSQRWANVGEIKAALAPSGAGALLGGLRSTWERWRQREQPRHERYHLSGHGSMAWCAIYSPDGEMLASGGNDQMVRLWRVADGEELAVLRGHTSDVMSLAWQPGGRLLASGGGDGTVLIWQVGSPGGLRHELRHHRAGVLALAWHSEGELLASTGQDGQVLLWRLDHPEGPLPEILGQHGRMCVSLSFSPDGNSLCSAGLDGAVRVWWL
ncbi:MAG: protein kinase [Oscillochloris sp.]|nr:protein kinase [Oscillochloris sp.]